MVDCLAFDRPGWDWRNLSFNQPFFIVLSRAVETDHNSCILMQNFVLVKISEGEKEGVADGP